MSYQDVNLLTQTDSMQEANNFLESGWVLIGVNPIKDTLFFTLGKLQPKRYDAVACECCKDIVEVVRYAGYTGESTKIFGKADNVNNAPRKEVVDALVERLRKTLETPLDKR